MIATENQGPLHSQFSSELKQEMGNRATFADISRLTFQGDLLVRFAELMLREFFLNLLLSTRRAAQGLGVVHEL